MRRHVLFLSAIILLMGSILVFALALREPGLVGFVSDENRFQDFLKRLQSTQRPRVELNLSAMYGGNAQFQLLHPALAMKGSAPKLPASLCSPGEAEALATRRFATRSTGAGGDEELDPNLSDDLASAKYESYIRLLGSNAPATEEFLLTPPFIDKSGWSYAYLLAHKGIAPFDQPNWLREHLSFFRPSELKGILERHRIQNRPFETIAQLSSSEVKNIAEGSPLVLTANFIFVKNQSHLGFSPLSYWAYDIRDVRAELKDLSYDIVPIRADAICLEKVGNACWTYNSQTVLAAVSHYAVAGVISSSAVLVLLCALYLKSVLDENERQRKHRTSLQVLSHEFRTPVSAMLLLLDQMTKSMSRMSETDQDLLMKLSTQAFRLQRIIEMTKTYLESANKATRFKPVIIPSINTWIEDFALDTDPRIRCEFLSRDQSLKADPFWLRFVLTNLVQNAFTHGFEPVFIRLCDREGRVRILVEDQGACEFDSLDKMSGAFVKGTSSQGMGLGLNMTSTIIKEWGGELEFTQAPTTFSFSLDHQKAGAKRWRK